MIVVDGSMLIPQFFSSFWYNSVDFLTINFPVLALLKWAVFRSVFCACIIFLAVALEYCWLDGSESAICKDSSSSSSDYDVSLPSKKTFGTPVFYSYLILIWVWAYPFTTFCYSYYFNLIVNSFYYQFVIQLYKCGMSSSGGAT